MSTTVIRSVGTSLLFFVGPLVMLIGLGAGITAIVLMITLEPMFVLLFMPALFALTAGALLIIGARRARLLIDADGFRWRGAIGAEQSVSWHELEQLLPPPPGTRRGVAIAQLRDGRRIDVRATWESPTSPAVLLGVGNQGRAQQALLAGHRSWLAGHR